MPDTKVTLSFPVHIREEAHGVRYGIFTDTKLGGIEYGSDGQIRAKLKARLEAQLNEAVLDQHTQQGRVIGCGDGTVFVVFFRMGTWHAGIYGPGHTHGGYTVGGKDLVSVVESTKRHAADVFGGVAWETSL